MTGFLFMYIDVTDGRTQWWGRLEVLRGEIVEGEREILFLEPFSYSATRRATEKKKGEKKNMQRYEMVTCRRRAHTKDARKKGEKERRGRSSGGGGGSSGGTPL